MARILWFATCAATLLACERSPHPEYKKLSPDTHLRLYMLGDGERLPRDGDSVLMRLRVSEVEGATGSLFSTEQWYAVEDLRNSAFNELMVRMHEGDSMSLITHARLLPWDALLTESDSIIVRNHNELRAEVSLIAVRSAAQMEADEARVRAEDPEAFEQRLIFAFLDRLGSNWQQWGSSFIHYTIDGIAEDTTQVMAGDLVTISYTGKRLEDGTTFDSSVNNEGPMTFRFGDKDQVVNGLEVAITLLREGQEGDFLLPSEYAFGSRGVEGMVAPYTPVIYTLRLEDVQRIDQRNSSTTSFVIPIR